MLLKKQDEDISDLSCILWRVLGRVHGRPIFERCKPTSIPWPRGFTVATTFLSSTRDFGSGCFPSHCDLAISILRPRDGKSWVLPWRIFGNHSSLEIVTDKGFFCFIIPIPFSASVACLTERCWEITVLIRTNGYKWCVCSWADVENINPVQLSKKPLAWHLDCGPYTATKPNHTKYCQVTSACP